MLRHFRFLLLSLAIHGLLLGGVFYSFKELSTFLATEPKEKTLCLALSCISSSQDRKQKQKNSPPQMKKPPEIKKPQKQEQLQKKISPKIKVKKEPTPMVEELVRLEKKSKVVEKLSAPKEIVKVKKSTPHLGATQVKEKKEDKQENLEKAYMDKHIHMIVQLLQENLYYPRNARKRGIEGEVMIRVTLSKNAEVVSSEIISSKHPILSRGAIKTIKSLSGEFPKPREKLVLSIPINYSLRR